MKKIFIYLALFAAYSGKAAFVPLPITSGLTADVIANGVGTGLATTTADVDGVNYAFVVEGWQSNISSTPLPWGLPSSGVINSLVTTTSGLSFNLASYSANNSLRIATNGSSGTLTFGYTPVAKSIYVLATSGSGISYFTGQINFTDNTSQAISTQIIVPDWFNSTTQPIAAQGFGRINRNTDAEEPNAINPRLYQIEIQILAANQGKGIASIQFTKAPASGSGAVINIFAVSADIVSTNDAGVISIPQPVNFCPNTTNDVQVLIKNFGNNQISSVNINIEINGVPQASFPYFSLLDTVGGTGQNTALVTVLPNYLFGSGAYEIKAWTSFPNGQADTINVNDTASKTVQSALTGTFTVGGAGADYPSLAAAAITLTNSGVCGPVVLNVDSASGPYTGQVSFSNISGLSATNTILVNGNGAVIQHAGTAADIAIVKLVGVSYVRLNRLNIRSTGTTTTTTTGILITGNSNFNTIENCSIDLSFSSSLATTVVGIAFSGATNASVTAGITGSFDTIRNNRIIGSASGGSYYGITLVGNAGAGCTGNVIEDNLVENFYAYGVYAINATNNLISRNEMSKPNRTAQTTFAGVFLSTACAGNIVERNRIHNPCGGAPLSTSALYPIYLSGADAPIGNENRIYNNLIYNITGNGTVYGIYNTTSDGMHAYYNTISLDNTAATGGITRGFYQLTLATNIEFRNNIISITRGGSGVKHGIYLGANNSSVLSNNNVIYLGSAGTGAQHVGYFNSDQTSLAAWQLANGGIYDQNSAATNPQFQNVATNNLVPTSGTANNIGLPVVGITTDFDGVIRNATNPDPGVYEFSPVGTDLAMVSISGITSGCGLTSTETAVVRFQNAGATPITGFTINYILNGAFPVFVGSYGLSLASGAIDSMVATGIDMSAIQTHGLKFYCSLLGDGNPANDTILISVVNIPSISTFPYFQNFDAGAGGWISGGVNNSWALGTPSGSVINSAGSGNSSWVTNLSGSYNNNERSYVESPCFNISSMTDPHVELKVWWNMESNWDGAALRYSTDAGNSWQTLGVYNDQNATNWYNGNLMSNADVRAYFDENQNWWSGRNAVTNNGSGTWVTSTKFNTGLNSASSVIFRIAFGTDGSIVDDGFAFDDFSVSDGPLGVKEESNLAGNSIEIYPNPIGDKLTIKFSDLPSIDVLKAIRVIDLNGRQVYIDSNPVKGMNTINFAQIKPGIYIVELETESNVTRRKVVKEGGE